MNNATVLHYEQIEIYEEIYTYKSLSQSASVVAIINIP